MNTQEADLKDIIGKTMESVFRGAYERQDALIFETTDGEKFILGHKQVCCEYVTIDDICGDLDDLVGSPIVMSEYASNDDPQFTKPCGEYDDSFTWTFYKFATVKGYVDVRFYGTSNGYYSERVDFLKVEVEL